MNCLDFHQNLSAMLGDTLEPALLVVAEQHLASCPQCLMAWTDAISKQFDSPSRPDISTPVLATLGLDTCSAALDALCEHSDETKQLDTALALHLETCPACAKLSHTLLRLNQDLPSLQKMSVPTGFTNKVIARTSAQATLVRQDTMQAKQSWRSLAHRVTQRPRIALEAAYALSLALIVSINMMSQSNDSIEEVNKLISEARNLGEKQGQFILGQNDELIRSSRLQLDRFYESTYTQISTNSQKTQQWINEQAAQIMRTVESAQESLFSSGDQQLNI